MIIDTHTHFYDPFRPQGVPWPEKDDEILYRRALPEDYKALAVPEGVTGTVMVECSPWVEDNQWVLDLAAEDPFIVGLVGHLEPDDPNFAAHLERFAADPVFLGIRARVDATESHGLTAAEMLVANDLELDTGLHEGVPALAERFPELRIVINHIGGIPIDGRPARSGAAGIDASGRGPSAGLLQGVGADGFAQSSQASTDGCGLLRSGARCAMGFVRRGSADLRQRLAGIRPQWPRVRRHTALGDDVFYRARRRSDGKVLLAQRPSRL